MKKKFNLKTKLLVAFLTLSSLTLANSTTYGLNYKGQAKGISIDDAVELAKKNAKKLINDYGEKLKSKNLLISGHGGADGLPDPDDFTFYENGPRSINTTLNDSSKEKEILEKKRDPVYGVYKLNDAAMLTNNNLIEKSLNAEFNPEAPYGIGENNKKPTYNQLKQGQQNPNSTLIVNAHPADNTNPSNVDINYIVDKFKPVEGTYAGYDKWLGATTHKEAAQAYLKELDDYGCKGKRIYLSIQNNEQCMSNEEGPRIVINRGDKIAEIFAYYFFKYYLNTQNEDIAKTLNGQKLIQFYNPKDGRRVPSTEINNEGARGILLSINYANNASIQEYLLDPSQIDIFSNCIALAANATLNKKMYNYAKIALNVSLDENGKLLIYVTSDIEGGYLQNLKGAKIIIRSAYPQKKGTLKTSTKNLNNLKENDDDKNYNFNEAKIDNDEKSSIKCQTEFNLDNVDWKNDKNNKFYIDFYGQFKNSYNNKYVYNKMFSNLSSFLIGPEKISKIDHCQEIEHINNKPGIKYNGVTKFKALMEKGQVQEKFDPELTEYEKVVDKKMKRI